MKKEFDWDRLRLTDEEKAELWERIGPGARRRWWERVLPSPLGSGRRWLALRPLPAFVGGAVALTLAALVIGQFTLHGQSARQSAPSPGYTQSLSIPPAPPARQVVTRPEGLTLAERGATTSSGGGSLGGAAAPRGAVPPAPASESAVGGPAGSSSPMANTPPVTVESTPLMVPSGPLTKYAIDSVEDAIAKQSGVVTRGNAPRSLVQSEPGAPAQVGGVAPSKGAEPADRFARAVHEGDKALPPALGSPAERRPFTDEKKRDYYQPLPAPGRDEEALEQARRARELELRARELREREEYEREFRRRCWIPPHDPRFDMMYFKHTGINPFVRTEADALSTFALDVDNASYTVTRAYIERGQLPPEAAVRVEEFVNFFKQDYPPAEKDDFRIVVDGVFSPFHEGYYLLRVGLRARDVRPEDRKPASITLVIDVSGSMRMENRLELVKRAVRVLLDRLDPSDTVGIVTYTTHAQVVLEPTRASRRELIESVIDELEPQQTTNLDQGLQFGYRMAREAYRPGAINRIVLCTDGVANEGITNAEGILDHVRREADAGIHLTAIGVGMGNYNDVLLEKLADKGDGNYYYVDSMDEARRVFGERLTGTLQTVAKDAKVQVEFDPGAVARWRLIGYEKRALADRDFRNDAVDAGEVGAGHQVTALYEIRLADRLERDHDRVYDSSAYHEVRRPQTRLGVVRLRYREPESEGRAAGLVREQEQRFSFGDLSRSFRSAPERLRLDAAVAGFAEILRGSYWARGDDLSEVARIADDVAGAIGHDSDVQDFARLVRQAAMLHGPYRDLER